MKLKYIIILALSLLMTACSDREEFDLGDINKPGAVVTGDSITVDLSVVMPEMPQTNTRAFSSEADYNDLHLYIFEFADNGSPLKNTMTAVYHPTEETPQADRVVYKVTLAASDQSRILHLVAVPKSVDLPIEYGIEATVIPNLKVSDGTPAYWRRLTFPNGYITAATADGSATINEAEIEKLKHVALVRNFIQVSMTNKATNFVLNGFSIVNQPVSGTVAPWNPKEHTFPDFLDQNGNPLDYTSISSGYSGTIPAGTSLTNPDAGPTVGNDLSPKYMYERPFSALHHTYILIKGHPTSQTQDFYYKLDLGKNDSDAIFNYFNLLRNFAFNISINSVATKGYNTIQEAVEGVVYNNLSFDIDLSGMLNISDGQEIVYVNFTTAILTDTNEQVLEFKYRYRNISGSGPTYNNSNVDIVGLQPGAVIKSINYGSNTDDASGWRTIKITCYPAEKEYKVQSFTIVKQSGLGRTINLVLHEKWNIENYVEYNGKQGNYNSSTSGQGVASPGVGNPLTIFFDIPDELPNEVFPLVFTLEADKQNLENSYPSNMVVTSGSSIFSNISGSRIKYEKTITLAEYNDAFVSTTEDTHYGTVIDNPDGTVTHRVRCFFQTIVSLDDLNQSSGTTTTTRVRMQNPNFNDVTLSFTRTNR